MTQIKTEESVTAADESLTVVDVPPDTPPDGGYGWVVVGAISTLNCFTWGVAASYGVYLSYYLADQTYPEAAPLDYAFIGGLEFGVAMLIAPAATILTRELGKRFCMISGLILHAAGFIAASFARRIWQLYLSQGLCIGIGIGLMFIPSSAILPQWFLKRRSLANGISSAGSGIGGIAFSLGTNAMIEHVGLPWALRITGLICLVANLAATLLLRDRNHLVRPPQLGFAVHLLKRYDVLLLLSWAFVVMFGYMALLYSLSDFGLSIALSQSQASALTAFLNLGTAVGRPFVGVASDYFGRIKVACLLTFACGILIFAIWIPATNYGVTILFSVLSGAILGTFWMTIGPLSAEVAGLREVPSMLSLAWISVVLPCTFAEVIALYLRRSGSSRPYLYPQIFAGLAYLVASLFLFALWRIKRKPGTI
ncbi:hypothetical protein LTR66_006009 [Elasticomyces elasticus]|nr:hypothetical protein LTR66_006009 [Elasticomyces elasticus]